MFKPQTLSLSHTQQPAHCTPNTMLCTSNAQMSRLASRFVVLHQAKTSPAGTECSDAFQRESVALGISSFQYLFIFFPGSKGPQLFHQELTMKHPPHWANVRLADLCYLQHGQPTDKGLTLWPRYLVQTGLKHWPQGQERDTYIKYICEVMPLVMPKYYLIIIYYNHLLMRVRGAAWGPFKSCFLVAL